MKMLKKIHIVTNNLKYGGKEDKSSSCPINVRNTCYVVNKYFNVWF